MFGDIFMAFKVSVNLSRFVHCHHYGTAKKKFRNNLGFIKASIDICHKGVHHAENKFH